MTCIRAWDYIFRGQVDNVALKTVWKDHGKSCVHTWGLHVIVSSDGVRLQLVYTIYI